MAGIKVPEDKLKEGDKKVEAVKPVAEEVKKSISEPDKVEAKAVTGESIKQSS